MRYLLALFVAFILAAPVSAADRTSPEGEEASQMGGFEGPISGAQAETVAKALELPQDGTVMLTGNIISRVAAERNDYIFKDSTGQMTVRITPKYFKNHKITPKTRVRLVGKIDKPEDNNDKTKVKVTLLEVL